MSHTGVVDTKHGSECGIHTTITVYPVPTHDFHVFWTFLPEAANALSEIGAFIQDQTRARADPAE
ncbi:MAG TPA: hypothetical protein VHT26_04965 [Trebonia sp.]|nr:hypothetical protein [Trebonia sp.]